MFTVGIHYRRNAKARIAAIAMHDPCPRTQANVRTERMLAAIRDGIEVTPEMDAACEAHLARFTVENDLRAMWGDR